MKIEHNIKREGKTLIGKILNVTFEGNEERNDCKEHYTKDGKFYICSIRGPQLKDNILFVWGCYEKYDNKEVSHTYETEEEAQQALKYINEFTIKENTMKTNTVTVGGKEYPYVYVSNESDEDALAWKDKRILLHELPGGIESKFIVTAFGYEKDFINGKDYGIGYYRHAVPVPQEELITIKTEDGLSVEIEKEKAKELGFNIK